MSYVPPISVLKQKMPVQAIRGEQRVNITYDNFLSVLKLFLRGMTVDELWYLARYTDVADGIQANIFKSARHLFIEEGYFEDRLPCDIDVDVNWYLANYPDVETA